MNRSDPDGLVSGRSCRPTNLSQLLFPIPRADLQAELEQFRLHWEAAHGPTDLTRHYTSTWAEPSRTWLFVNEPKKYFDGLPPFVQEYLWRKMRAAARDGSLDDAPATYMQLFVRGLMDRDAPSAGRLG